MMTQERVKDLFEYDDGVLMWKEARGTRALKGAEAGGKDKDGFVAIQVDGKRCVRSRLVFLMFHGEYPDAAQCPGATRPDPRR